GAPRTPGAFAPPARPVGERPRIGARTTAPGAAPAHGPRACPVCDVRLQACWPFREDDQHCSLCGLRILRLGAAPTAPDGHVWLYRDPVQGPLVRLVWERGPEDRPDRRQPVRPHIDFPRCHAHFGGARLTALAF